MSGVGSEGRRYTPQELQNQLGEQYFGAEIEMIVPHAEITEIVEAVVGVAAVGRREGQKEVRQKNIDTEIDGRSVTWGIDIDTSLSRGEEFSGELVSPKLRLDEISHLENVINAVSKKREPPDSKLYVIDDSCSNHIHVNAGNMSNTANGMDNPLVRLYANYFVAQDVVHNAFAVDPDRNRFCKKLDAGAVDNAMSATDGESRLNAFIPIDPEIDERDRFMALNYCSLTNPGTVEFRLYNGLDGFSTQQMKANAAFSVALTTASRLNVKLPPLMRLGESPQQTMDSFLSAIGLGGEQYAQTRGMITGKLSPQPQLATPEFLKYHDNYTKYTNGLELEGVSYSFFDREMTNDPAKAASSLLQIQAAIAKDVPSREKREVDMLSWMRGQYAELNKRLEANEIEDIDAWRLERDSFENILGQSGAANDYQYENLADGKLENEAQNAAYKNEKLSKLETDFLLSLPAGDFEKVKQAYLSAGAITDGIDAQFNAEQAKLETFRDSVVKVKDTHTVTPGKYGQMDYEANEGVNPEYSKTVCSEMESNIRQYFNIDENENVKIQSPDAYIKMIDAEMDRLKQEQIKCTDPQKIKEEQLRRQSVAEIADYDKALASGNAVTVQELESFERNFADMSEIEVFSLNETKTELVENTQRIEMSFDDFVDEVTGGKKKPPAARQNKAVGQVKQAENVKKSM